MRAIITVIGKDRKGIIAGISTVLARAGINILDIHQTTLQEYFTMLMLVDLESATENFRTVKELLSVKGSELGVQVQIQREEIFNAMHRV